MISHRPQQKKESSDKTFVSKLQKPSVLVFTANTVSPEATEQKILKKLIVEINQEETVSTDDDQKLEMVIQEDAKSSANK